MMLHVDCFPCKRDNVSSHLASPSFDIWAHDSAEHLYDNFCYHSVKRHGQLSVLSARASLPFHMLRRLHGLTLRQVLSTLTSRLICLCCVTAYPFYCCLSWNFSSKLCCLLSCMSAQRSFVSPCDLMI